MTVSYETVVYLSEVKQLTYRCIGGSAVGKLFIADYTYLPEEFPRDTIGPYDRLAPWMLVNSIPGHRLSDH